MPTLRLCNMTSAESHWYVYMVRCADGSFYTGAARDLDSRVAKHQAGNGARYTRSRLPIILVYSEELEGHSEALKREHEIKQMSHEQKFSMAETWVKPSSS